LKSPSLNHLGWLQKIMVGARRRVHAGLFGMDLDPTIIMSLSAKPDLTFPKGIHIGAYSYVAFEARILTHDRSRGLYLHTRIGRNCFIGGGSIILPGVTVGDDCVIGAGSVVTRDVPPRSVAAGNPARVIRSDIEVGPYGRFVEADDTEWSLREQDPQVGALPAISLRRKS